VSDEQKAAILADLGGTPKRSAQFTEYGIAILRALQSKTIYQGTVPEGTRRRRRAANRRSAASRRVNRQ
jgi:hypothetical protein